MIVIIYWFKQIMKSWKFKLEVDAYLSKLRRFQAFCIDADNMKEMLNYFNDIGYLSLFMLDYQYYFRMP